MTSPTRSSAPAGAKLPLTYLFVPGNRPERFDKALQSEAGAVVVDFEDAVAPGDKAAARAAFASWYGTAAHARTRIVVRINDESTPWFAADRELVRDSGVRGVMLPKAETPAQIERIATSLADDGYVIPIVESARAVVELDAIAHAARVQRLAFGTLDYAVDLDIAHEERALLYPACRIALSSRVAGIASPIAGVTTEIGDEQTLRADVAFARACGFGAKLCIHPKQVAVVHAAFRPSEAEVAWARRVIAASKASEGAVQVDGKMVDRPVITKAMRILAQMEP